MYKARQYLKKSSLVNLYYLYVYPYLIYCIEVWGCAYQTHLQCLFLLPEKYYSYHYMFTLSCSHRPLFMSLEILPLEKIFYHRYRLMMYTYYNNCFYVQFLSYMPRMIVYIIMILGVVSF